MKIRLKKKKKSAKPISHRHLTQKLLMQSKILIR